MHTQLLAIAEHFPLVPAGRQNAGADTQSERMITQGNDLICGRDHTTDLARQHCGTMGSGLLSEVV